MAEVDPKWSKLFDRDYFVPSELNEVEQYMASTMAQRIMLLDGGMGTTIQKLKFSEEDFRGDQFKEHKQPLKGNNDLLCLTQPDAIRKIHADYLRAGSDVIETNTFNATSISQGDYGTVSSVRDINIAATRLAKEAVDIVMKEDGMQFDVLYLMRF